MLAVAEYFYKL